ncbi:MAG TPA: D-alanine--D-alanine ligase family protein [Bacteroidota bacterium]|nr:D-alanine--D-alanine ligase family protein [Bacteroidota bacterium]
MASKLRVGVIFGGRSAEHQVSLVSAASVINALDKKKYEVIPIGISPSGKWLSSPDAVERLKSGKNLATMPVHTLLPDPEVRGLFKLGSRSRPQRPASSGRAGLDVIFPVLHGTFGEDGTMQGLFELAGIPYVGAGVLGSSVGMDKIITKQLCERAGIPVAPYIWFLTKEFRMWQKEIISRIEQQLGYPCFVKPANTGSSVGISKAHNRKELLSAVRLASEYDRKILVEKSVEQAREIEVSVLGNDDPEASLPGEIISSNEFYDYDAKYVDGKSKAVIPAKLPKSVVSKIRKLAVRTFKTVECSGMGRVDFLVTKRSNKITMNEINTIPGFTSISMYPKMWEASGLSYPRLLDRLIELALERFKQRQKLRTVYTPKSKWYNR